MGKPAARLTDMHVCPMVTGLTPHVGGPISAPGVPTVLIGGLPAAVVGDICVCTGPPDTIAMGSAGVMIGGKPAARMGDMTAHGGTIAVGCPTVLVGEVGGMSPGVALLAAAMAGAVYMGFPPSSALAGALAGATPLVAPGLAGAIAGATAPALQAKDKSWFSARVTFADSTPAPNVGYRLILPDDSERTGYTDSNGMVRLGGIPAGDCKFSLTEFDGHAWERK